MNKLISYILWPALAGLVFAGSVLLVSRSGLPEYLFPSSPQENSNPTQFPANFSFSQIIAGASQSVVSLNTRQMVNSPGERIYVPGGYYSDLGVEQSQGSGVIISADGYIITNLHNIIVNQQEGIPVFYFEISLHDKRRLQAQVVASDEYNDLILLKVNESDLPFLSWTENQNLSVGDIVLTVGHPRNLGQSVSMGIISALLDTGENNYLIQTDAAVNPGNSGGALIDHNGNLTGITSFIVSESGGFEGIGFATPASRAFELLDAYLATNPIGYLGVDAELTYIPHESGALAGFLVGDIDIDSAAETAGIKVEDLVVAINEHEVKVSDQGASFNAAVRQLKPGDEVLVHVLRDGELLELPTIVGEGDRPFYYHRPILGPNRTAG